MFFNTIKAITNEAERYVLIGVSTDDNTFQVFAHDEDVEPLLLMQMSDECKYHDTAIILLADVTNIHDQPMQNSIDFDAVKITGAVDLSQLTTDAS